MAGGMAVLACGMCQTTQGGRLVIRSRLVLVRNVEPERNHDALATENLLLRYWLLFRKIRSLIFLLQRWFLSLQPEPDRDAGRFCSGVGLIDGYPEFSLAVGRSREFALNHLDSQCVEDVDILLDEEPKSPVQIQGSTALALD